MWLVAMASNSTDKKIFPSKQKVLLDRAGRWKISYERRNKSQHKGTTKVSSAEAGEVLACFQQSVRAEMVSLFSGVSCPDKIFLGHLVGFRGQL